MFTTDEQALLTGVDAYPNGSKYLQLQAARAAGANGASLDRVARKLVNAGVLRQTITGEYGRNQAQ